MQIKKTRILSGITTTGNITLGNYIGAIKNFIKLQQDNELIIFVANLHAITTPIEKQALQANIKNLIALYYACGLDPEKSTIFIQSDVLEHCQLAHILLCNTTLGELYRMTQFKDKTSKIKSENNTEFIPTGLLTYPTLMAADILLYDPNLVPVGKDQKQHIELARNIALRMNNKYDKQLFTIPNEYIGQTGAKIMDLQIPDKKMSKSNSNPKSYIALLDPIDVIEKKIKSAITDSENKVYFDTDKKPAVSNLMTIYSALTDKSIHEIENEFKDSNYGVFKNQVAQVIIQEVKIIQQKYHQIMKSGKIDELIKNGAEKARSIACKKLKFVQDTIGLNYQG